MKFAGVFAKSTWNELIVVDMTSIQVDSGRSGLTSVHSKVLSQVQNFGLKNLDSFYLY